MVMTAIRRYEGRKKEKEDMKGKKLSTVKEILGGGGGN